MIGMASSPRYDSGGRSPESSTTKTIKKVLKDGTIEETSVTNYNYRYTMVSSDFSYGKKFK